VAIINNSCKKVKITYPVEWKYRVIGKDKDKIQEAIKSIMQKRTYGLSFSNTSSKGSYHSYELCTLVHNEDDRIELFYRLKEHNDVKMVL